jgi:hypothetical protein
MCVPMGLLRTIIISLVFNIQMLQMFQNKLYNYIKYITLYSCKTTYHMLYDIVN